MFTTLLDGSLGFPTLLLSQVRKLFNSMDETGDGCLNLEEFQLPGTAASKIKSSWEWIFLRLFWSSCFTLQSKHAMCFFQECAFSVP